MTGIRHLILKAIELHPLLFTYQQCGNVFIVLCIAVERITWSQVAARTFTKMLGLLFLQAAVKLNRVFLILDIVSWPPKGRDAALDTSIFILDWKKRLPSWEKGSLGSSRSLENLSETEAVEKEPLKLTLFPIDLNFLPKGNDCSVFYWGLTYIFLRIKGKNDIWIPEEMSFSYVKESIGDSNDLVSC